MIAHVGELLSLWEQAASERPAARPIALLAADGHPAHVSLGLRNARLFRLRERMFGQRVACLVRCSRCDQRVEFEFTANDVLVNSEPPPELAGDCEGYRLRFRTPAAADLAALSEGEDFARQLFRRCLVEARRADAPIMADELPDQVVRWAAARMAEADRNADIRLELECPSCGESWRTAFDIAAFFWAELDFWANRLLDEVHALAEAYGWSESEILGLSPTRRRCYLERVT